MMIPNYSGKNDWNRYNAMGVTQYGQMTAGSFMYIGPQGIVHGTTITLLNAGRKMGLGDSLAGRVFVTSGLGGMSGAQAVAAVITGCVGVIAETDADMIRQRLTDGYIKAENVYQDAGELVTAMESARAEKKAVALVYHGNIVELWERFVRDNVRIELGSDQTGCHNINDLGYCPAGYTFEEARDLLNTDKKKFLEEVGSSTEKACGGHQYHDGPRHVFLGLRECIPERGCVMPVPMFSANPGKFTLPEATAPSDTRLMWRISWGRCASITDLARSGGFAAQAILKTCLKLTG
jgi:urocanate hydratase